ncbi:MAG: metallopeptidase family protein [Pseudomonadota bacterium]
MRDWSFETPPDLLAFQDAAHEAFDALPENFRALCNNVVIHVADEADAKTLGALGLSDPLQLSGLFEGVDRINDSVTTPFGMPNHVHLYRRSIIAEWRRRRDTSLRALITHVLVHELGHHFGFSDDDMHAIEAGAID